MAKTSAKQPAIPILRATDGAAVSALLDRRPARTPAVDSAVAGIIARVRRQGDRALLAFARQFDRLEGEIEVPRAEMRESARAVPPAVKRAIRMAAAHIRVVAARQVPKAWTISPVPGLRIAQRVTPLDRVGCYVPGGRYPLPSSLLMTAIPAVTAGVGEVFAVCPRPDPTVMFAALEARVTRLFRIGGAHAVAALAYGTESIPRVDKIVGPGNAYVAAAKAQVASDCAIDFFAGPSEIAVVSVAGRPDWIAADLIAQAEHDPDARAILFTPVMSLALAVAHEIAAQLPSSGPAAAALRHNGGIVVSGTLDESIALSQRLAPEHVVCDTEAVARRLTRAGTVFVGPLSAQACGDYVTGSNHVLPTSGAASARGGLSAADFVRVSSVQRLDRRALSRLGPPAVALAEAEGLTAHAASVRLRLGGVGSGSVRGQVGVRSGSDRGQVNSGAGKTRADLRKSRSDGRRGRIRSGPGRGQVGVRPRTDPPAPEAAVSHQYERPEAQEGGLRLHLNENTAGCSPQVLRVLRDLPREQAAFYPDYDAAIAAAAGHFGVDPDRVVLTNGLDDGIMLASLVMLRGAAAADPYEAIVVLPAFDMYAACADAMGARIVDVPPQPDFVFPLRRVLEAITPRTRIIFLTNPNNPTGRSIPKASVATVAAAAADALVFLDEAYADFAGHSMMAEAASGAIPNLLVGRTFAKAFGLAGLRVGALIGTMATLAPIRRAILPYTLNAYAAAALPAAIADRDYFEWYLAEVRESKKLLYDVLARSKVRFWPSDGNFVLACFGDDLGRVIAGVASRGISIRDRSGDPGCEGCARITAGVLEHTRRVVTALEEVLCGAR